MVSKKEQMVPFSCKVGWSRYAARKTKWNFDTKTQDEKTIDENGGMGKKEAEENYFLYLKKN